MFLSLSRADPHDGLPRGVELASDLRNGHALGSRPSTSLLCAFVNAGGRPNLVPSALARLMPLFVRSIK
jgi:hypothetical protein